MQLHCKRAHLAVHIPQAQQQVHCGPVDLLEDNVWVADGPQHLEGGVEVVATVGVHYSQSVFSADGELQWYDQQAVLVSTHKRTVHLSSSLQ